MWNYSSLYVSGLLLTTFACSSGGAGSSGSANGGASNSINAVGRPAACVIGSAGCACDSSGACASGNSCTNGTCCDKATGNCSVPTTAGTLGGGTTTNPGTAGSCVIGTVGCTCASSALCALGLECKNTVCCDATTGNCTASNTGTGTTKDPKPGNGTGTTTPVTVCTPGVTGPVITDCGYPYASNNPLTNVVFNESEVLRGIEPSGGSVATVRLFYNDEHALTMGVRSVVVKTATGTTSTDFPVSQLPAVPSNVSYPATGTNSLFGDNSGLDQSLRPMWPVLYITDTTIDPESRVGDWQQGGKPFTPNAVFGTWKAAIRTVDKTVTPNLVTITPDADPAKNVWDLGPSADPVPTALVSNKNEGYGAEVKWDLALVPGHNYRVQVIVHDGDQNKVGGDTGEACVNFCTSNDTSTPPPPTTTPPPQCEGNIPCGPGGIDPLLCPSGTLCANGCCLSGEIG